VGLVLEVEERKMEVFEGRRGIYRAAWSTVDYRAAKTVRLEQTISTNTQPRDFNRGQLTVQRFA